MGPFLYPRRWDSGICGTPHLNQQEVKSEAFSTTRMKAQVAWMVFHSSLLDEKIDLPNSGVYFLQVSNMEAPHEIVLWFIVTICRRHYYTRQHRDHQENNSTGSSRL
ncbi:hypothetical protein QQF64_005615 [Cirrhinus molitorella]|uniref:Uncharacterized protein n=1 Tax=Cirrhinus molitorella TaxID=172907 RepID=A0ABR3MF33_9TELE